MNELERFKSLAHQLMLDNLRLEKESLDWQRWQREILTDYKVRFDDHEHGRRLAIAQLLFDLNNKNPAPATAGPGQI